MEKLNGKVIWYSLEKGFGFIETVDGKSYFVHQSDILMDGFRYLDVMEEVTFEPDVNDKGDIALHVTLISPREHPKSFRDKMILKEQLSSQEGE